MAIAHQALKQIALHAVVVPVATVVDTVAMETALISPPTHR